jgi:hypothetical protein
MGDIEKKKSQAYQNVCNEINLGKFFNLCLST